MNITRNQSVYRKILNGLLNVRVDTLIYFIESIYKPGDLSLMGELNDCYERFHGRNLNSQCPGLIRKAEKDLFSLRIYQFIRYCKMTEIVSVELFEEVRKEYKQLKLNCGKSFKEMIGDKIMLNGKLKGYSLSEVDGELVAKLMLKRGVSLQVKVVDNKLWVDTYLV